jgi:hypothetical protein
MDKRRLACLRRQAILAALVGLAFSVLACQTGAGDLPLYGATAQAAVYQATAVAEATRTAQDAQARATADALAVQAQATRQVLDAQATAWALSATQTAAAQEVQATATARAATATALAQEAQGTAAAAQATATRTAQDAQAEAAQATLTARAERRQDQREETTQALVTAAPWVGAALFVAAMAYLLPGVKGRITTHRRKQDEAEPIIVDGDAIRLPLRGWDVRGNAAPTPDLQERTTARAQLPAVIAAGRGRRGVVHALPQAVRPAQLRGPAPGLVKVVAVGDLAQAVGQGILPPRLAQAIEGQWTEVQEDDSTA